jgi:ATP-binding cassette subfamily B protein
MRTRVNFHSTPMDIPIRRYAALLSAYLRPQRGRVLVMAALLLTGIALQLVIPQILRTFIDAATGVAPITTPLAVLAVLFIAVALAQQVVSVGATYLSESVGWTATNALRADVAAHCMRLDMPFHNQHTPGEFIERIDGDVSALANFFSAFIIQVFGNVILLAGVLVLLAMADWRIGLVLLIFVVIVFATLLRMRKVTTPLWMAERQAFADYYGFLEERLAGTEDIRSSGAREYTLKRFHDLLRTGFRASMKAMLAFNVTLNITWVFYAIGTAAALVMGGLLFQQGALTLGGVYLVFQYTLFLQMPIDRITRQIEDFQQASASISRIEELLALTPTLKDGAQPSLPTGALGVTFDDVSFAYGDDPILKHVSFALKPSMVLGLLGRTGSGKTTLARLLFRLYDVSEGSIRLTSSSPSWPMRATSPQPSPRWGEGVGTDIRDVPLDVLRARVGMVTQDVQLFHATVRDNLTFFDATISDAQILGVIEDLGLWGWYAALPNGLDTELQTGNAGLSAGEAQLLAFTRVFLRNPSVVVLDEATSRLDRATEKLIERAVDKLLADRERTAIIIAHRLNTVQRSDEIMILADGEVVEHGRREALAADPSSRFYTLLQTGMEKELA